MKLMSLNCPNCNGVVKQIGEGKFHCENCGTSFLADYDRDDVEYQRVRSENEFRKQQMNMAQMGMANAQRRAQDQEKTKKIVIGIVIGFFLITMIPGVIISAYAQKMAMESSREQERIRQEKYEQEQAAKEEQRRLEQEQKAAEEEAKRQALIASYQITPEKLLADSFFVENANKSMDGKLEGNTNLYYTNWVFGEPEYITSYIQIAKDENNRDHNRVVNLYKVSWDKVFNDRVEHYEVYDGTCIYNVSLDEDGSIKCSYSADQLCYHSEIIANQFLSGFTDYDQMIREVIYGNADFTYTEFKMQ